MGMPGMGMPPGPAYGMGKQSPLCKPQLMPLSVPIGSHPAMTGGSGQQGFAGCVVLWKHLLTWHGVFCNPQALVKPSDLDQCIPVKTILLPAVGRGGMYPGGMPGMMGPGGGMGGMPMMPPRPGERVLHPCLDPCMAMHNNDVSKLPSACLSSRHSYNCTGQLYTVTGDI